MQNLIKCSEFWAGYLKLLRYPLVPDLLWLQKIAVKSKSHKIFKIFKMVFNTVEIFRGKNFF